MNIEYVHPSKFDNGVADEFKKLVAAKGVTATSTTSATRDRTGRRPPTCTCSAPSAAWASPSAACGAFERR